MILPRSKSFVHSCCDKCRTQWKNALFCFKSTVEKTRKGSFLTRCPLLEINGDAEAWKQSGGGWFNKVHSFLIIDQMGIIAFWSRSLTKEINIKYSHYFFCFNCFSQEMKYLICGHNDGSVKYELNILQIIYSENGFM